MRALALTGPRARPKHLRPFQSIAGAANAEFQILDSPDAAAVSRTIESFHPDIILIFGGDGTLNRHLSPLVHGKIPVLVVPIGSGNDFAKANGIESINHAANLWERFLADRAHIEQTDLGLITATSDAGEALSPRYFSCCANIGLDSDAAQRANALPIWLKANAGYVIGAVGSMMLYHLQTISVSSDAERITELAWFVSVSNTPTYGGGLKIAPQASITDGQLDITYLPRAGFSRVQLLRHLPKIFSGSHQKLAGIRIFAAAQLSIETGTPLPIYADAEYIGLTPCQVVTAPKALSVLRFQGF